MTVKRRCTKYESYQLVQVDNEQHPTLCTPRQSLNYKGRGGVFQGPIQAAARQAFKRLIRKKEIRNNDTLWLRKRDRQEVKACISKVRVSRQPMQPSNNNNARDEVAKCIRDAAQCHSYTVDVLKSNVVVKFDTMQPPQKGSNMIREQAAILARIPSLEVPNANNNRNGYNRRSGQQIVKYAQGLSGSSSRGSSSRGSSSRGSPALLNTSSVHHHEAPELFSVRQ